MEGVEEFVETRNGVPIADAAATVSGSATPLILERLARRTGGIGVDLGRGDPCG
jgi:hypothetical protein